MKPIGPHPPQKAEMPNSLYQRAWYPILLEHPPQDSLRDMVERSLKVHKAHVDWLGELPCTLQDTAEGIELVQCSMARTNQIALPESEVRLSDGPSSPEPPNRPYQGGLRV
ncbi:hypothetical protein AMECASPLE_008843 [Ameca splendens]|uniref:Uncharacterized protein n=1 Tax=Ameca splendens TaxID=208324 RepID=A0ABV0ZMC5_9TELE